MTTVKRGSRGETVKLVQNAVGVTPDGIFGRVTENAVKAYQKSHGLTVDGIAGPKTQAAMGIEELPDIVNECENLKQYSSPHGSMPYGPDSTYSTYRSGGCGVTSFAIVQRALGLVPSGETSTATIQRLGRYAWQHGYRVKGHGTTAGLFKTNGTKSTATTKAESIESAIRAGKFVILLIKKGFPNGYTGTGHYVVAYGIKGANILLRDVGSSTASRQTCPLEQVTKGLKYAYIITKQ